MADLKALQLAGQRNAAASRRLEGLDEDYDRANVLRDSPMPAIGRFGYQSPLSALATVMRRKRGEKMAADIQPRRKIARDRLGFGEGMLEGHALEMTMAKEGRAVTAAGEATAKAGRETAKHDRDLASMQGEADKWTNKEGDMIAVGHDEFNKPYMLGPDGEHLAVPEGYAPADTSQYSNRIPRTAYNNAAVKEVAKTINDVSNAVSIAGQFEESFAKPFSELPTEFVASLGTALARNDLLQFITPDMDQDTKDAMQWWANWRMAVTLPRRYEWFGATLTPNELKSWAEAEMIVPGMAAPEINRRMAAINEISQRKLMHRANMHMQDPLESNRNYWIQGLSQTGLYNFDETSRTWTVKGGGASEEEVDPNAPPVALPPPLGDMVDTPAAAATSALPQAKALLEQPRNLPVELPEPPIDRPDTAAATLPEVPIERSSTQPVPLREPPLQAPARVEWTPEEQAIVRGIPPEDMKMFQSLPPEKQKQIIAETMAAELPPNAGRSALPLANPRTAPRQSTRQAAGVDPQTPGLPQAANRTAVRGPQPVTTVKPRGSIQAQALPRANPAIPQEQLDGIRVRNLEGTSVENLEINRIKNEKNLEKVRGYKGNDQPRADAIAEVLEQNIAAIDAELAARKSPVARDKRLTEKMIEQYPKGRPTRREDFDKLPSRLKMFYMDKMKGREKNGDLVWG